MNAAYRFPEGNVFYRKLGRGRPMISHGQGVYLYDTDGRRYLDGSGGPLVVNVGHGRSEIVRAMSQQAEAVAYVHATMFTTDVLEQFSASLARVVPIPDPRFYFLSSGSEAVEGALKLARQIQMARGESNRYLVICRSLSYHGTTLGAMGVSGRPALRSPYMGMFQNMPHIRHPYPYRYEATGTALADRLEEIVLAYGPENVAGFIGEPISGSSLGAVVPPDDYWPRIRAICDRYGILLIADEVLTGMGRTGRWWGIEHWDVEPDILVTAKGIASGYFPLSAVAARRQDVETIATALGDFNHGGTYSHHAVGAAAGLATLQIIQRERLVERAAEIGALLGQLLHEKLGHHPHVGDIRGRGLLWALEFVADRESRAPFPAARHAAARVWAEAFTRGLLVYYSQGCVDGQNGDLILVGPPLIITPTEVDELVSLLTEAVEAVF
ncbi:MAG: aspartate aminotransferase family protein [Candidatus Promineifilaceae bacterium]|nr:aspartate aminotransferase family protein [Candidatus Promineifilaceae bacterium]